MEILLLIFGLISFVGLVIVHEWGHFIAARKSNVDVEEFGVGFPPKAATLTKKNGTEYTLNWLPLGGFVRLKGEHDADTEKGSFGAARLSDKVKIMVAGVVMNLLTAFILFTIVALIGMPQLVENQFNVQSDSKVTSQRLYAGYVDKNSPADKAGLENRDQIVAIAGPDGVSTDVSSIESLPELTKKFAGKEVTIFYKRSGQDAVTKTTLLTTQEVEDSKNTDSPKGYLGIVPTTFEVRRATWSAPVVAAGTIGQFTQLTLKGVGTALSNLFQGNASKASEQVSGPVGVFVILRDGSSFGFAFILMIIALISLTLAIFNILPIPALDGGRLFVTLLFRALKKPLTSQLEDRIHGTGMAVLLTLFVLITIVDVRRFF